LLSFTTWNNETIVALNVILRCRKKVAIVLSKLHRIIFGAFIFLRNIIIIIIVINFNNEKRETNMYFKVISDE